MVGKFDLINTFANRILKQFVLLIMVVVAQLVRAPDCGSGGRGFEPHLPPSDLNPKL